MRSCVNCQNYQAKRTPSKRLSFIERAQKESEELLRNMGGSFELEGGRRTRSSTRGTTPGSSAALITPPPAKRNRRSPNVIAAGLTPARPPRGRGRKLEVMTSQVDVQDSKNPSTLSSSNNNNKTKNFLEVKVTDVLKTYSVEDTENVDISIEQTKKENQQITSGESKQSSHDDEKNDKLNAHEQAASNVNQFEQMDDTETDNDKVDIAKDKPGAKVVSSAPVTAAVDRVQDIENVGLTMGQSLEEKKADNNEVHETQNDKIEDVSNEIQQPASDKIVANVGTTITSISTTDNTTIVTTINSKPSLPSVLQVSNIEEVSEVSDDGVQKEDEPDNSLIMEIGSDDNSSQQMNAEESADDANIANKLAKPSESKEIDLCKESTNSTEKSLQMDTINLDDSSIESEKKSMDENVKQSSSIKAIEVQSAATEHEISVDKDTATMPAIRIADDAISLDYDTDNFSNKSESNVNDLKIVDDIETDDVDDAVSDDAKSTNENKLLGMGVEEEINDETVAIDNSMKLATGNKCLAEGSNDAIDTTHTTHTTTTTTTA